MVSANAWLHHSWLTNHRMHYPKDANTYAIETQFFYGPSLMVNPVTQEGSSSVSFYVPNGVWYDLFTRKAVQGAGSTITYSDVPTTDIAVLVHGGSIVPLRTESANTTRALRDKPFELLVAPRSDGTASGSLYLDDGESLDQSGTSEIRFALSGSTLKAEGTWDFPTVLQIKSVTIMGSGDAQSYELNKGFGGSWSVDVGSLKKL
jgi:alpha-glucosidase